MQPSDHDPDDRLARLLDSATTPVPDHGFTDRTMRRIRRLQQVRRTILAGAGTATAALVLAVTPLGAWLANVEWLPERLLGQPSVALILLTTLATALPLLLMSEDV